MKKIQFLGDFIYCDLVTISTNPYLVTLQGSRNQVAWVNTEIFNALDANDPKLAKDITPTP